jgi:hypothetical protein
VNAETRLFTAEIDLFATETDLFEPEIELFDAEIDLFGTEIELFTAETRLFDPEIDLFTTEIDLFEPEIDLFEREIELFATEIDLFDAEIELFAAEIDLFWTEGKPIRPWSAAPASRRGLQGPEVRKACAQTSLGAAERVSPSAKAFSRHPRSAQRGFHPEKQKGRSEDRPRNLRDAGRASVRQ